MFKIVWVLLISVFYFLEELKKANEGDGVQVHMHLMVENLTSCFFNFSSADLGASPFILKEEMK